MMGRTTELRREIKSTFVPYVEEKGYVCSMKNAPSFIDFKKITNNEVWVFDIQFEKYGSPRFVVNFGKCSADGVELNGIHYTQNEIIPSLTPGFGRLQPGRTGSTGSWFRQDKHWLIKIFTSTKQRPAREVVNQLISMFSELEQYFEKGTISEHLRIN
jgi:hypothetical protein